MFGKINLGTTNKPTQNNTTTQQPKSSNMFYKKPQFSQPKEKVQHSSHKTKIIKKQQKTKKTNFMSNKLQDLQGAKFRLLNQMLYTHQSSEAANYFKNNTQDFQLYHEGYRHQANKWEFRPVDQIIQYILQNRQHYFKKTIIDLGCGEGFIYEELKGHGFNDKNIKSYDLVSIKPFITAADIAHLPLKNGSVDLCIFCLSLMGTNYLNFIREAWRVLNENGQLIISEVESRSPDWKKFVIMVNLIGFTLVNDGLKLIPQPKNIKTDQSQEGRFFRTMHFKKVLNVPKRNSIKFFGKQIPLQQFSTKILQSCNYKKR